MTGSVLERRVLALAAEVEADAVRVEAWYRADPIAALGGHTAHTLVAAGAGDEVVGFLLGILGQEHAGGFEDVLTERTNQHCGNMS